MIGELLNKVFLALFTIGFIIMLLMLGFLILFVLWISFSLLFAAYYYVIQFVSNPVLAVLIIVAAIMAVASVIVFNTVIYDEDVLM